MHTMCRPFLQSPLSRTEPWAASRREAGAQRGTSETILKVRAKSSYLCGSLDRESTECCGPRRFHIGHAELRRDLMIGNCLLLRSVLVLPGAVLALILTVGQWRGPAPVVAPMDWNLTKMLSSSQASTERGMRELTHMLAKAIGRCLVIGVGLHQVAALLEFAKWCHAG